MLAVLATLAYFTLLMLSFLAARLIVVRRGWSGVLLILFFCSILAGFFTIAPLYFPWVPATSLLSLAIAQMILIGAVCGVPAGLLWRWRSATKARQSQD